MRAKSISDFRKNIAADIDAAVEDHVPLIITRPGGKDAAVVMSLEDFNSWQETAYLLSSPANAERLRRSIADLDAGKGVERKLLE
ncbi:MAG: type II toxin-antitoxin system prevent-host-death family antitoxin [Devosia sp.]|uniref:type II toxin-antitoxin system Phd/YefM family antitoxin n=1 Tax=Devosia sp. TaxID=1871048 RepID=UPI0024CC64C8|nr:type II toxin-antitoxin system prevent-host-death family antitoxin [Devosia sp.]UYN98275.1 MAG: type II toxin-antitoxin system prevent-host-death family antitoxin [Devosia sp.]